MVDNFPAGTESIRNLKEVFSYFLVVKEDSIANDIPQMEYFVYKFIVPISEKDGVKQLNDYFKKINSTKIYECRSVSYNEYAVGNFLHPTYKNNKKLPLKIKMRDLPIYTQSQIRVIDLEKDKYQYGSKPVFISTNNYNSTQVSNPILDQEVNTGVKGRKIID